MKYLLCLLTLASAAMAQTARIEGQVQDSLSAKPLARALLRLRASSSLVRGPQFSVMSEPDGTFSFDRVPPGVYVLRGEADGYLSANYGVRFIASGEPIHVNPGETIKLDLSLKPRSSISGQARDEEGNPLANLEVQTLQWRWNPEADRRQLSRVARTRTAEDGTFRIANLSAGSYYLSAGGQSSAPQGGRQDRGRPASLFPLTYYPEALEAARATVIELHVGESATGKNLRMRRSSLAKLRGKVVNGYSFQPVGILTVDLISLSDPAAARQTETVDGGSFEFARVVPGRYTILARDNSPAGHLVARLDTAVEDHDVNNLRVELRAGLDIKCIVRKEVPRMEVHDVAERSTGDSAVKATVIFRSAEGLPLSAVATEESPGAGPRLRNVAPGRYWADLAGLPPGYFIKWIHLGNRDVTSSSFQLEVDNSAVLEVLLSNRPATLTGKVNSTRITQVYLSPANPRMVSVRRLLRGTLSAADGSFRFADVTPGDYVVLALEDAAPGLVEDPGFRAEFSSYAVPAAVVAGATQTLAVEPVPTAFVRAVEQANNW
jgi:Carboxypeptidase regulatory-like domain